MPPLRGMEFIPSSILNDAISRAPDNQFIIWTGHPYAVRQGSLRSGALLLIKEIGKPVPLRDLLRRAAAAGGEKGFDPDSVRSGVRLHQGSKPAVYLFVQRDAAGDYRAVRDIPFASPKLRRFRQDEVIMDRHGRLYVDCLVPR
jgi:hypothetical protein